MDPVRERCRAGGKAWCICRKGGGKWKKTQASNSRNTTHRSKKKERQYQTRMKNLAKAEVARKEKEEAEKLAGKGMVE